MSDALASVLPGVPVDTDEAAEDPDPPRRITDTSTSAESSSSSNVFSDQESHGSEWHDVPTVGTQATERLAYVKQQGRLRLLRLRVPTISIATSIILGGIIFNTFSSCSLCASIFFGFMRWAAVVYMASILPNDKRFSRIAIAFGPILGFVLLSASMMSAAVVDLQESEKAQCSYFDEAVPCWILTYSGVTYLVEATAMLVLLLCLSASLCRSLRLYADPSSVSQLLRAWWLSYGCLNVVHGLAVIALGAMLLATGYSSMERQFVYILNGLLCWLCGSVCLERNLIGRMQSWLMSRGEAAVAAAGVAELLGGRSPEAILSLARQRFLYVSADKLRHADMAESTPNPALGQLTRKAKLGQVDAFVSHSWSDCTEKKWEVLQEWRQQFKRKNKGREPRLWIDKYCIDQNNIDDSLACLPVFLAGCSKLLVLCGKTYLSRLWCLIEIMVFLEMGGEIANLEVIIIDDSQISPSDNRPTKRNSLVSSLQAFDPRNARCFTDYDTKRLQSIVEVTGYDRIAQLVHEVFTPETSDA